jgi:hypothetical protein
LIDLFALLVNDMTLHSPSAGVIGTLLIPEVAGVPPATVLFDLAVCACFLHSEILVTGPPTMDTVAV